MRTRTRGVVRVWFSETRCVYVCMYVHTSFLQELRASLAPLQQLAFSAAAVPSTSRRDRRQWIVLFACH